MNINDKLAMGFFVESAYFIVFCEALCHVSLESCDGRFLRLRYAVSKLKKENDKLLVSGLQGKT